MIARTSSVLRRLVAVRTVAVRTVVVRTVVVRMVVVLVVGLALAACSSADAVSGPTTGASDLRAASTSSSTSAPTTTTTTIPAIDLPLPPGDNSVYVLGDSVILGTQYVIHDALAGWNVTLDAAVSRRFDQGLDIVRSRNGRLGRVVVVHLCTNWFGGDYGAAADQMIAMFEGVDRIVWATCTPWIGQVGEADAAIRALPSRHPNLAVIDWAAIASTSGYTGGDGLHLQTAGAQALTGLVSAALGPVPAPA